MPSVAPNFTHLFAPGTRYPWSCGDSLLVVELPGVPLSLPSGRIVAIEPFLCGSGDPASLAFTQQVSPGTYPVVLVAVDVIGEQGEYRGDTRVAAARLDIRDEPVATWELAVQTGQDTKQLPADEVYDFPIGSGWGSFVDAQTFHVIGEEQNFHEEDYFAERVLDYIWKRDSEDPISLWPEKLAEPVTVPVRDHEHAVVVFTTGWGDGIYDTWIGRTADGDIACFLSDFEALPDMEEQRACRKISAVGTIPMDGGN